MMIAGIILSLIGMGVLLGVTIAIVFIELGRRIWPFVYVIVEERQGNLVANIVKGKTKKDKSGSKNLYLKKTMMSAGLGALFSKAVMSKTPEKKLSMVKKGGGNLILAYSPADNIFMPISILKDAEKVNMIVEDEDVRNWYKITWEKFARLKILSPKRNWEKLAPVAIFGAGLLVIVMLIVGNQLLSQQQGAIAAQLSSIYNAVQGVGQTVAQTTTNATIIPY